MNFTKQQYYGFKFVANLLESLKNSAIFTVSIKDVKLVQDWGGLLKNKYNNMGEILKIFIICIFPEEVKKYLKTWKLIK